ncbi:S-adenosylmethionine decarboxylase related protein [Brevibacillus sp. SYP-B805]|uniref:S-adenosylmethionine decarboxylase related protein n=1 Tax=Brevibacillus sp. SYP-B805 TaxID=1578199 RepID=UPI0013EB30BC|nr:S-adenosylmethionine decarboxylase related protein [Brevibacillus sp. SYP-B805]NGQ96163.1 S-adenosylmethionine decarboxylase related protein [Brevibacillus sp. SYP-B805]
MESRPLVISILGSGGGVAKAVLSILNQAIADANDPIHALLKQSTIHLIDVKPQRLEDFLPRFPHLQDKLVLHQLDLRHTNLFKQHLRRTRTTLVIDVSWADTVEMLRCCNELGVLYTNTALENMMVDENEDLEGFTLIERYRIFEQHRHHFTQTRAIVCSGMNPGVVQWMALKMIAEQPGKLPLGCYIVEHDDSFYADTTCVKEKTVYSTWSPECFLDEALLNYPMFVKEREPLFFYQHVYNLEFKVTLGKKQFYGCLMPHEEVLTLGRLSNMETGFIYRVNDYTTNLIRSQLGNPGDLWNWHHQVMDPSDAEMDGSDLVGVLLVYEDKERYMYNVRDNRSVFAAYQVNATYFQVACGVYGAVCSLLLDAIPAGVHYVDELLLHTPAKYGEYVTRYLKNFVTGENPNSDGLLLARRRNPL